MGDKGKPEKEREEDERVRGEREESRVKTAVEGKGGECKVPNR